MGASLSIFRYCQEPKADLDDDDEEETEEVVPMFIDVTTTSRRKLCDDEDDDDCHLPSPFGDLTTIHEDCLEMEYDDATDATSEVEVAVGGGDDLEEMWPSSKSTPSVSMISSNNNAHMASLKVPVVSLFQASTNKMKHLPNASSSLVGGIITSCDFKKKKKTTATGGSRPRRYTNTTTSSRNKHQHSNKENLDTKTFPDNHDHNNNDDDDEEEEEKEELKLWFKIFFALDRIERRAQSAGAMTVGARLKVVRNELNTILGCEVMDLSALARCHELMELIKIEFLAPPLATPRPKHKLSIQDNELKLLRHLDEVLTTLSTMTDPVLYCRASPSRHHV